MTEQLNFREHLSGNVQQNEEKQETNQTVINQESKYQTYSQGVMAALDDKGDIRWNTFWASLFLGLFPWIFGVLGLNTVPEKYIKENCSYDFIKGYKSKKKSLKFLPSFLCWLTLTNLFYLFIGWVIINNLP